MRVGELAGWHVVVLMFTAWLLAVPIAAPVEAWMPEGSAGRASIGRLMPFLIIALIVLCVTPLRDAARAKLAPPIPHSSRRELSFAVVLAVMAAFAWMGAYVLWWHFAEGPVALERRLDIGTHADAMQRALSVDGLVVGLLVAGVLAPIVEETIFRGFLFSLWEKRHGWVAALLLNSTLFALYHPNFLPAFVGAVIDTCVYSRTRSLKASILTHASYNLLVYYPVLGRFVYPRDLNAPGDLRSWAPHVLILTVVAVAVPMYAWFARSTSSVEHTGQ